MRPTSISARMRGCMSFVTARLLPDARAVSSVRHDAGKLGEVGLLAAYALRTLVEAGYAQELVYYPVHAPALPLDYLEALGVVLRGLRVLPRVLALGEDNGHGRAQLMRGVGGEALLGVEAPLEPVRTSGRRSRPGGVSRPAPRRRADAGREVGAVVYGVDGVRYLTHGLEGVAGDEPAYDGGYDDEHGQEYEREYGYDARGGRSCCPPP